MPILFALFGNLVIAAITVGVLGWNSAGAHAAARNTARFSALWCAAALASPALSRVFRGYCENRLIYAFVAAHTVHFVSVAALLFTFEGARIAERAGQSVAVIATGSSLILGLGLAAGAARPLGRAIRSITLYAASLIFLLAFFHHTVRPLRAIAVIIAIAVVLRLASNLTFWTVPAKPT
jgi:hypothetical protein